MEEIEELRAKAIASMPSSSKPKSKSSESKEEGELSPSDDTTTVPSEMPACSPALSNSTMLEEHLLTAVVDNHAAKKPDCPVVKAVPSSRPTMVNTQIRSSVKRNYSKHFKKIQVPYKSTNNQSLSWHGKCSDDNLVISFSDDDNGSSSEESSPRDTSCRKENISRLDKSEKPVPEKTISGKDNIFRANKLEVPILSAGVSSKSVQSGLNRSKYVLKRGLANPASNPSATTRATLAGARHLSTSAEKDSPILKHNSNINTSTSQEHGQGSDPVVSNHRLTNLRHEISFRENELKVQRKSVPQGNTKNAVSYSDNYHSHAMLPSAKAAAVRRPASVADIGLAPREHMAKRLQPVLDSNSKQGSAGQSQLPLSSNRFARECNLQHVENSDRLHKGDPMDSCNDKIEKQRHALDIITRASSESSLKVKDGGPFAPVPVTLCHTPEISSRHDNHIDQRSRLPQSDPNTVDRARRENNASHDKILTTEHAKQSNISGPIDSSSLVPRKMPGQQSVMRTLQNVATAGARVPLKMSNLISERHSGQISERASGDDVNLNISGEVSVTLQSLMELEHLQDKELEQAQELRRWCELEERRALKAYREAQRALIDANEKCSHLYRKRELFSAQHRALLMQASSSMWSPSWQNNGGTVSDSVEILPEPCKSLSFSLEPQLPEGQILGQLHYESNTSHSVEAQPHAICQQLNKQDFVSGQCWEQDASTSYQRDNNALDGVLTPVHHPHMSTDNENILFDHRPVESRLSWDTTEGNRVKKTANVNAEIGLPSNENAQDYELLEASLRSKLVKQFGHRISYKSTNTGETDSPISVHVPDKSGDTTKFPPLPDQQMLEAEQTQMSELEGDGMLRRGNTGVTTHNLSQDSGLSLTDDLHRIGDSDLPIQTAGSPFPSSVLHVASRNAKSTLLGCFGKLLFNGEKEAQLCEKFTACAQNGDDTTLCNGRFEKTGGMELPSYDFAIDPFWPFCMFELRGKCNNEDCRWQHSNDRTMRNLVHKDQSATSFPDNQASHLSSVAKSDDVFEPSNGLLHILSIPAYYIGSNLIKVDSHLSRSLFARSIWQYWQRGFCASFSLPFSHQRILPPDAPSLQTSGGPVADDYGWNRLSLYYQTPDYPLKQVVRELPESEQCLEMALDLFDGSVCQPDRKKALCMLSRAIEADPTSVALWVVYLHIFHGKENIEKDDMFFHAVQHNEGSYELWLLYINSRMRLGDRLDAYEYALTTYCRNDKAFDEERRYISACILDIFLQMIDFLCMAGNVEQAVQKIFCLLGDSGDTLLLDIHSFLIVSDRCIFWFCCIYLVIYRKLPELILRQFEFEKELPFGIEWPSAHLNPDAKERALDLLKLAVDKMTLNTDVSCQTSDQATLRSSHFVAICHVKCVAVLEGPHFSTDLLATYLNSYPTCIELILMSARMKGNNNECEILSGFEEALSIWPEETPGTQCLWNQYAEHALENKRIDIFENVLTRWFQGFCKEPKQDDVFGFLNLSLYRMLQKNVRETQHAIDKALELSSPRDYIHCVREHAAFTLANEEEESDSNKHWSVMLGLISGYLGDPRSATVLEPLSRKYFQSIKKPRVRHLINNLLGPVSKDCTLVNSVLEVCYGSSLVPVRINDPKGFVDFVEALMEMIPANYTFALSVYKLTMNFGNAVRFWACSLLINSIFQAVPVAPEHIWIEAANVMSKFEISDISVGFHQQAVSVYPFSIKLWQSYMYLCRNTDKVDTIVEIARTRGIEL